MSLDVHLGSFLGWVLRHRMVEAKRRQYVLATWHGLPDLLRLAVPANSIADPRACPPLHRLGGRLDVRGECLDVLAQPLHMSLGQPAGDQFSFEPNEI